MIIRTIRQSELGLYFTIARRMQRTKTLNILRASVYRDAIDHQEMFMAFEENEPVGLLMVYRYKREPTIKIEQIASVRKGVGRKLFEFAVQLGRDHKANLLRLEVRKDNLNAIAFYEHLQMQRVSEKPITYVYTLTIPPKEDTNGNRLDARLS